jgi:hypothetical protein
MDISKQHAKSSHGIKKCCKLPGWSHLVSIEKNPESDNHVHGQFVGTQKFVNPLVSQGREYRSTSKSAGNRPEWSLEVPQWSNRPYVSPDTPSYVPFPAMVHMFTTKE